MRAGCIGRLQDRCAPRSARWLRRSSRSLATAIEFAPASEDAIAIAAARCSRARPIRCATSWRAASVAPARPHREACRRVWAENRRRFFGDAVATPDDACRPASAALAKASDGSPAAADPAGARGAADGRHRRHRPFPRGLHPLHRFRLRPARRRGRVLATTLIVIDVTLAALFWAWGADEDIIARLVKKTLFVGVFAYIIGNWNDLAKIVFESFAGLGLKAAGTGLSAADLLRPGRVAQVGLDAGRPILQTRSPA